MRISGWSCVAFLSALSGLPSAHAQSLPGSASATSLTTPQQATTPPCPGFTVTTQGLSGAGGAIADASTTNFVINVSGAQPYVWDLDVTTFITHTACWDLDIRLISPAGTSVALTTDNGGSNDDVFNGTLWDDSVIAVPVTDFGFSNGVTATPVSPEGSFTRFRGENPNGAWTLAITDDVANEVGSLASWRLDMFSVPSMPGTFPLTFAKQAGLTLTDNTTVSDSLPISNIGTSIAKVALYVEVLHTSSGDLDINLTSPQGVPVPITSDNGSFNDNCFNGTWFDEDAPTVLTDATFSNNVVMVLAQAEGALDSLVGQNPNGTWTIDVTDDANTNTGTFVRWQLKIWTCGACSGSVTNYCTAGTSSSGCVPALSVSGAPSTTSSSGFVVTCNNLEAQRSSMLFYGTSGRVAWPWTNTGSSSFMCVKSPVQRTPAASSGGTSGQCDGQYSIDLNQFWSTHPSALGQPLTALATFQAQAWYRDPPAPKGTHSSNAIEFFLCP